MSDNAHPLAEFRTKHDPRLTQDDLGEKVGVDGMTISRWERGERVPQKRHWPKLTEVTGIPIEKILAASVESAA